MDLLFMYFTGVLHVPLDHEIYTNVKKASKLIKFISSYNICSGINCQQEKKTVCHSVIKTFDFSQNSSVPFHQATFDHSISCVLLIDKSNESFKSIKKFERNTLDLPKSFQKEKKIILHRQRQMPQTSANFANFFRTPKINNSNLSNQKQRT